MQKNPLSFNATGNMLRGEFGFISTLIGTNPAVADMFGCGGLTGEAAAAGVANQDASFIESIVKTANAGEFLITFADGYRKVHFATAEVWSVVAGPADGFRACCAVPANQGSGRTTKMTMLVTIVDPNTGAPGELDARTVCVQIAIKT